MCEPRNRFASTNTAPHVPIGMYETGGTVAPIQIVKTRPTFTSGFVCLCYLMMREVK